MADKGPIQNPQPFYFDSGFRFRPTDDELIGYLLKKILDTKFVAEAIGEVNVNKCEPWDLPNKVPTVEGNQWYFFCMKDRKYPASSRTNRATEAGYWKATGKDKEVFKITEIINGDQEAIKLAQLIGMKKTLVFYKGRAPKGERTNWVMHEYRLEGSRSSLRLPADASKDDWVMCRVFRKSPRGNCIPVPDFFVVAESPRKKNAPLASCSTFVENQPQAVMDSPVANVDFSTISLDDLLMSCLNAPDPIPTATPPVTSVSLPIPYENTINVPVMPENPYGMNPNFLLNDPYLPDPVNHDPSDQLRALLQGQQSNNCALPPPPMQHEQQLNHHLHATDNIVSVPQNTGFNSNLVEPNIPPFQTFPLEIPNQDIPSSAVEPVFEPDFFWDWGV